MTKSTSVSTDAHSPEPKPSLDGWFTDPAGPDKSPIHDEHAGIEPELRRNGKPVAYLRSTVDEPDPIVCLYQAVNAVPYRGKRIRFSADILGEREDEPGRLWLRVVPNGAAFNYAFGYADATTEWHRGEIVVDVDPQADSILFGAGVWNAATVWVSDVRFEVVDESVALTAEPPVERSPDEPVNLSFEGSRSDRHCRARASFQGRPHL